MLTPFLALTAIALLALKRYVKDEDPYKCQSLIDSGNWLGGSWIPRGCHLVDYAGDSLATCTQGRKRQIVFAGDLQLQGSYYHMVQRMTTHKNKPIPAFRERDLQYETGSISMSFLFDPYLNGSSLIRAAEAFRDETPDSPMLLVVGAADHASDSDASEAYLESVRSLASTAYAHRSYTKPGSTLNDETGPGDLLLFAPAEQSLDEQSSRPSRELNQKLRKASMDMPFNLLTSFTDMANGQQDFFEPQTIVVKEKFFRARADLLLNLRCNAILVGEGSANTLATCCAKGRRLSLAQLAILFSSSILLPVITLLDARKPFSSDPARMILRIFATFAFVIALVYVVDRSTLFDHVRKDIFRWENFGFLSIVTFLFGVATIRRTTSSGKGHIVHENEFLPRDQTSEWKGWMQLVILFYHYGQAAPAPLWHFLRLCVSSYLFLTGYGHTVFLLQKKDYSLERFMNIIIRLNLLAVTLAYAMRTSWVSYYYIPLCTIWFIIVWITLAIGHRHNSNPLFLFGKIATASFILNKLLYTPGFREALLDLCTSITKGHFPNTFFDRRLENDRYIVFIGMATAPISLWLSELISKPPSPLPNLHDGSNPSTSSITTQLNTKVRLHWSLIKNSTIILSLLSLPTFWHFRSDMSKTTFSSYQAYVNFIPILAFAILRTAHPTLRTYYSKAFAWLGKYSGEIYVLHFHIWLGADQGAVLRSGLFHGDETFFGDRWRDLVVLTPMLLLGSKIVGDATGGIAGWFVKDWGVDGEEEEEAIQLEREMEKDLNYAADDGGEGVCMNSSSRFQKSEWWENVRPFVLWPVGTLKKRSLLVLGVLLLLNHVYD